MRSRLALTAALSVLATAASGAPTVEQVLALKPTQSDIIIDTPTAEQVAQCRVEILKKPTSGWTLRDHRGLVVRRFIDSNGDNVVDQWSYFLSGTEVYRDVDTNFNGKADQCRWYNAGGTRWGVDENEDGVVDQWKSISAEEAGAEAAAALITRNFSRLKLVLLSSDDLKNVGLPGEAQEKVKKVVDAASGKFGSIEVPKGARFSRFDGHSPVTIPASDVGGAKDLALYSNVTILLDAGGQTVWLRVPEVVRVGDCWKLSDCPTPIDPNKPTPSDRVVAPMVESGVIQAGATENDSLIEEGEEIQKWVAALQKHDEQAPDGDDGRKLATYHVKRAELCARVGSLSKKLKTREHWYKQTADSLNAAAQTGEYPQAIGMLDQYAEQFSKTNWGKDLAAYFKYRAINAAYALELAKPNGDHPKAQAAFLAGLKKFLEVYPRAEDAADSLWQLGNGSEFAGNEEEARDYYRRLVKEFPKDTTAPKAAGALRRIDSAGQPFQLVGGSLGRAVKVDSAQLRGKIILVHYWATWCEPCKAEMARLAKIREKHRGAGLELLGVCLDSNKKAAEAYVAQKQLAWPQIYEEGSMESGPAVQYGIISLPYCMLVDAEGRVINKNLSLSSIEAEVEKAMAKKIASRDN